MQECSPLEAAVSGDEGFTCKVPPRSVQTAHQTKMSFFTALVKTILACAVGCSLAALLIA